MMKYCVDKIGKQFVMIFIFLRHLIYTVRVQSDLASSEDTRSIDGVPIFTVLKHEVTVPEHPKVHKPKSKKRKSCLPCNLLYKDKQYYLATNGSCEDITICRLWVPHSSVCYA